ncbi:MAG: epimerase [Lachnospiraceae bacterium]|nr:epimerase [Lachnospiraceae bacterium]
MEVLVLGGTGAMGVPLVKLLSQRGDTVYVTTRSQKQNSGNVTYICGNAKDPVFFEKLMNRNYDAIVDFMVYGTEEFQQRLDSLLNHTSQYFFFSSSRCYADSSVAIRENSPRLVDVCKNPEYLATDEYGLAKGKEENLLFSSKKKNWTIIRPYITYNAYRIQLGVYEKENWLRRALEGRTIVFPEDIANKKTSLTFGPDVAGAVVELIGNEQAYGQAFHITTAESHTWGEILDFYCEKIEQKTGKKLKVKMIMDSKDLQKVWNPWQIKYDRLYDRTFDNSKIESVRGKYNYKSCFDGLSECLDEFLENPKWLVNSNTRYEAWCDRIAGEITPLNEIPGYKNKLKYLKWRFIG